ncbi:MAG TPA: M20/M25/M40 family metallo-hydrolase [Phycisphaerae bacterium]|nr:M20/M25/M40 family metallo-hydrolase [Phycisphaerae bacterium]HPS52262.1 M20/M25/M40 family metallo-hydrolase [Phycisphaerae bacterium]
MKPDKTLIENAINANLSNASNFLCDLISTPSLPGQETAAMNLAVKVFEKIASVETVPLSNALKDDRDYSDPVSGINYDGRNNLRIVMPGSGDGKNLLLNTHMDTVPPSQGQTQPYEPKIVNGEIFGRGACDAKGQVATIYLMMAALKTLGIKLCGSLAGHIVVEEEVGGNGTLAMARRGENADGCVVLEPTEMRLLSSIRGAVWFHINVKGKPGHSGQAGQTRSALKSAIRIIEILDGYHADLLEKSRGDALFDKYPNPMPLTFGKLAAGNWPATAPGEAEIEGVLGLLPNKTAGQVMEEMRQIIRTEGGDGIKDDFEINFMYRHDASVCPRDSQIVKCMSKATESAGRTPCIDAMTASCDAWFYNNQLKIPTVVFGGGSLSVAHSNNEHMPVDELAKAAEILVNLAIEWCGVK